MLLFQNRGALDQGERGAEEEAGGEGGRDQELVAAAEQPRAEREGDQGRAARGKWSLSPFWTRQSEVSVYFFCLFSLSIHN